MEWIRIPTTTTTPATTRATTMTTIVEEDNAVAPFATSIKLFVNSTAATATTGTGGELHIVSTALYLHDLRLEL